jgi:hypothetical protein
MNPDPASAPTPEQVTTAQAAAPVATSVSPAPSTLLSGLPGAFPGSAGNNIGSTGGGSSKPILFILIGILGLGAVGFGAATVVFAGKAATATNTLNQQKAAAVAVAKDEQKKTDEAAAIAANESPFRSYIAPSEFGSFEIKFAKNWSGYVEQAQYNTQISLVANPEFVRRTNGSDDAAALRVQLINRPQDQFMTTFASNIKTGKIKKANITVSGLPGYDLTGTFVDKKTFREVVVPVRDKVIVFITENNKYIPEFNLTLAQSKIIP